MLVQLLFLKGTIFLNIKQLTSMCDSSILTSDINYNLDSLSFREVNYVEAFEEYEYELLLSNDEGQSLIQEWGVRSRTELYERHDADEIDIVNVPAS